MEVKSMLKRVSCIALAGLLALSGQALATDTRTETINRLQQVNTGNIMVDKVLGYGSNYDLRNYKYLTIQSPGSTNASWAIVLTNLLEQATNAKYSAKHLDYATATNSANGGNTALGYSRTLGSGGNIQLALGYLTSGRLNVNSNMNIGGLVIENSQSQTYTFPWDGNLNKVSQSALSNVNKTGRLESYVKFPSMYKSTYDTMYIAGENTQENVEKAEAGKLTLAFNDPIIYEGTDASAAQIIARDGSIESYTGGEIEENRQAIKEHIIKYGAVIGQIYRNPSNVKDYFLYRGPADRYAVDYGDDESSWWRYFIRYENLKSKGLMYYCNKEGVTPNQNVVIIGWDDEKEVPGAPAKGAYIVMDPTPIKFEYATRVEEQGRIGSWYCRNYARYAKNHEHIDGYCWWWLDYDEVNTNFYYVSYYDYYIESNVYGLKSFSTGTVGKTYQRDNLGISTSIQPENAWEYAYGANVFTRDTDVAESLDSISIASMEPMKYEIYVNPKNSNLSSDSFIKVGTTGELDAGYNTIYFDNPVYLTGQEFVVAVKYITTDVNKRTAKVGVQSPLRRTYQVTGTGDSTTTKESMETIPYWSGANLSESSEGISFIGTSLDTMTDLYKNSETKNMIVCIKAYTTEDTSYKIPAESIKIQKMSDVGIYEDIEDNYLPILKGDQAYLKAKVTPEDSAYQEVTWTSSNKNIASVDNTGTINALQAGKVTITARLKGAQAIVATCTVDVRVPIESFVLNKNNVTILAGETNILAGIFGPEDATTTQIQWATSNKQVVKVTDDGLLIGLKKGTAIVTATVKDENGTHTATCKVTVPESLIVDVLAVSLNKTSLTLEKGTRETLKATVTPADATNSAVVWTSSNKNVAIVNANGRITALTPGTSTITVTTVSGGETATCKLTVTENQIVKPTGITLNQSALILEKDSTSQLVATVMPSNCEDKTVFWESSNLDVVRVDTNGKITARTYGVAIIKVTTADGKYSATCTVTVQKPVVRVTGITLNKTALTLEKDATEQLIAGVQPASADNSEVTWSSSDTNIVKVSENGMLTAVGYGTATITATTVDGAYTKKCIVTVPQPVNVTGIEISAETLTVKQGRTIPITVSVLPADATNANYTHTISDETIIEFTGEGIKGLKAGEATITFATEEGEFTATCTVTVEAVENDEIDISSDDYTIGENDEITDVNPDTTVEDFKESITTDGTTVIIKDKDGNVLEDTDQIGTGSTIEISKEIETIPEGETEPVKETITETLTIKISGDVNGDGKVSSTDLSILKQYVMEETTLEGLYYEVADLNGDGVVSLTDLSIMKQQMVSVSEEEVEE